MSEEQPKSEVEGGGENAEIGEGGGENVGEGVDTSRQPAADAAELAEAVSGDEAAVHDEAAEEMSDNEEAMSEATAAEHDEAFSTAAATAGGTTAAGHSDDSVTIADQRTAETSVESSQNNSDPSTSADATMSSATEAPNKPASKPTSAKSGKSKKSKASADSSKASDREKSGGKEKSKKGSSKPSSASSSKKKGKGKKKKDEQPVDTGLPENVVPIFLTTKTQEIFNIKTERDVEGETIYRLIDKNQIQEDLFNRAAVSDFHPFKQQILDYEGVDLLLVFDEEFKHGQNFIIALTEQAKYELFDMYGLEEEEEEEEGLDDYGGVGELLHYTGPVIGEWISLGSEKEVVPEPLPVPNEMKTSAVRVRREFGAVTQFSDRNVGDVRDGYIECPPYNDPAFEINKIELDKSVQAVSRVVDCSIQTDWKYPRNAAVQYVPRELTREQKDEIEQREDYREFIENTVSRVELALQQNNILDVFVDDWQRLGSEENELGNKADNHLKEFQTFTDLEVSKDRMVSCVDWHPSIKGVVGVALAERLTFDERVDSRLTISMKPSLILVWSFADPIHPQLVLEAPDDIMCFKFCPTDGNIVAGGCINGQVVLWDISDYSERLRLARSGKFKEPPKSLPGFEDEGTGAQPVVRYAAVSAIDSSHRSAILDLQWVPEHFEANKSGVPMESKTGQCCQLISCSTDQTILWWDIRPPPNLPKPDTKTCTNPYGVPPTFKHLDLIWKPHFKINLLRDEQSGDHAPTRFSISESHNKTRPVGGRAGKKRGASDADVNQSANDNNNNNNNVDNNDSQTSNSTAGPTPISTMMYAGTEDGEVVYLDWVPKKDQDSGKIITPRPQYYYSLHDGPVVTLQRSPFFTDLILCVGGWSFSLWKEGVGSGPILRSPMSSRRLTGGHWSPTRPSVFFISLDDGGVDIWDLLDKTHEPCITQSISSTAVTCLSPCQLSSKQQLIAVCDDMGTLHVLTVPYSLRHPTPNERQGMYNYIEREVKRREFVSARLEYREREKAAQELEAKKKAAIAVTAQLTDDELESRMKREYAQYLIDEQNFLKEINTVQE